MYKRILVAVDGSPTSLRGLDEAVRFAKATGGRLLLVHVVNELIVDPNFAPSVYYESIILSLQAAGKQVLEQASSAVRKAEVPCEQKLVETLGARVADELVREAQEWKADLIVLGTHGRRGLKRLAMGSDAELVLRMSPVPVLLVRDQPEGQ
jgi:nucleotide-binding universal stress UspA family protein